MIAGELSDRRLWLTADRARVVDDGDPDAAFLLVAVGQPIPATHAEQIAAHIKATPQPPNKATAPPADKTAPDEPSPSSTNDGTPDAPPLPGGYDPGLHTVIEVLGQLDRVDADERTAILAAEAAGRARKSILQAGAPS